MAGRPLAYQRLERHAHNANDWYVVAAARTPVGVLLFDLNGFKAYNDTFGHPAGDALLIRLAIPNELLHKPGPLDPRRGRSSAATPDRGAHHRRRPALANAAKLVRSTHERLDGSGYPDGLTGDHIPLGPASSPSATPSPP